MREQLPYKRQTIGLIPTGTTNGRSKMEIVTYMVVSVCVFLYLELLEFKVPFLEKLGVNSFLIRSLVACLVALALVLFDRVLHNIN
jgi:hypothetical protein